MLGSIANWFVGLGIQGSDKVKAELRGVKGEMGGLGQAANFLRGALGALGVTMIARTAWSMAEAGAKAMELRDAFHQVVPAADDMLAALKQASGGTIAETSLMLGANKAAMLGLGSDAEKMGQLMEVARFRARAMGLDTTQAFSDIVTGLGRMSPLILDNLGLVFDSEVEFANYAESIGKAAKELTEAEKKQALFTATLRVGQEQIQKAGGIVDSAADDFRRLATATDDAKSALGQLLAMTLTGPLAEGGGWVGQLAGWLEKIAGRGAATANLEQHIRQLHEAGRLTTEQFDTAAAALLRWRREGALVGLTADQVETKIDELLLSIGSFPLYAGYVEDMAEEWRQYHLAVVDTTGATIRAKLATGTLLGSLWAPRLPGDPGYDLMVDALDDYYTKKDDERKADLRAEEDAADKTRRAWQSAYDKMTGHARGAMGSLTFNFDYASIMDNLGFHQDTWDEPARQAMDVVNLGTASPWYQDMIDKGRLTPERLAKFGGDAKAAAAEWIHEFELGMHPEAINMGAANKAMKEGLTKEANWEGLWGGMAQTWTDLANKEADAIKGVGKVTSQLMMMGMTAGVKEGTPLLQIMAEAVSPLVWKYIQDRFARTGGALP